MNIIAELEVKINGLKDAQLPYNTEVLSVEIKTKEEELNRLVSLRNNKKSIFEDYQEQVKNIEHAIATIRESEEIPATEIEDTAEPEVAEGETTI